MGLRTGPLVSWCFPGEGIENWQVQEGLWPCPEAGQNALLGDTFPIPGGKETFPWEDVGGGGGGMCHPGLAMSLSTTLRFPCPGTSAHGFAPVHAQAQTHSGWPVSSGLPFLRPPGHTELTLNKRVCLSPVRLSYHRGPGQELTRTEDSFFPSMVPVRWVRLRRLTAEIPSRFKIYEILLSGSSIFSPACWMPTICQSFCQVMPTGFKEERVERIEEWSQSEMSFVTGQQFMRWENGSLNSLDSFPTFWSTLSESCPLRAFFSFCLHDSVLPRLYP